MARSRQDSKILKLPCLTTSQIWLIPLVGWIITSPYTEKKNPQCNLPAWDLQSNKVLTQPCVCVCVCVFLRWGDLQHNKVPHSRVGSPTQPGQGCIGSLLSLTHIGDCIGGPIACDLQPNLLVWDLLQWNLPVWDFHCNFPMWDLLFNLP